MLRQSGRVTACLLHRGGAGRSRRKKDRQHVAPVGRAWVPPGVCPPRSASRSRRAVGGGWDACGGCGQATREGTHPSPPAGYVRLLLLYRSVCRRAKEGSTGEGLNLTKYALFPPASLSRYCPVSGWLAGWVSYQQRMVVYVVYYDVAHSRGLIPFLLSYSRAPPKPLPYSIYQ